MKSSVELLRDTVSAQKKKIQENKAEEEGKNNLYFSDILMYCFVNVVFESQEMQIV